MLTIDWNKVWNMSGWERFNMPFLDQFVFGLVILSIIIGIILLIMIIAVPIIWYISYRKEKKEILEKHQVKVIYTTENRDKISFLCKCGAVHKKETYIGWILSKTLVDKHK